MEDSMAGTTRADYTFNEVKQSIEEARKAEREILTEWILKYWPLNEGECEQVNYSVFREALLAHLKDVVPAPHAGEEEKMADKMTKKELREWMDLYHALWIEDHNKLIDIKAGHTHLLNEASEVGL